MRFGMVITSDRQMNKRSSTVCSDHTRQKTENMHSVDGKQTDSPTMPIYTLARDEENFAPMDAFVICKKNCRSQIK